MIHFPDSEFTPLINLIFIIKRHFYHIEEFDHILIAAQVSMERKCQKQPKRGDEEACIYQSVIITRLTLVSEKSLTFVVTDTV